MKFKKILGGYQKNKLHSKEENFLTLKNKKMKYYFLITFLILLLSIKNIFTCPFDITNDLNKPVFIVDDQGHAVNIEPGKVMMIDPSRTGIWAYIFKEQIDIYYETDNKNEYVLKFRLKELYCSDDHEENAIKLSDIESKSEKIKKRFIINEYIPKPKTHREDHKH